MTFWKRKTPHPFPDRAAMARYSGAKMLRDALADPNVAFRVKSAMVRDWASIDATDAQAESLGNQIARIPSERLRAP